MSRYGPTRGEWIFRLVFSLAGLALLAGGLYYRRGEEFGPGAFEAIITALVFFGGTAIWSVRKLRRRED